MYVLGIETSCDETAAAIVKDGKRILSNLVSSSIKFHQKYGGIVPEIAFRMQLETITAVVDSALKESGIKLKDIDLIAVTRGPGFLGSLVVGISFAKSLSLSLGIPLLGIDHLESHIYASFLNGENIALPFLALVVSGGHTSLFYVKDFDRIKLLGSTLDDACGESFDKVAKILGLGYPGGPLIERLAQQGNPKKIKFKCSDTKRPLDFSFSGIKTAVLYTAGKTKMDALKKRDIAASFQEAALNVLVDKALLACRRNKVNRLVVGGGVVANKVLRKKFSQQAKFEKIKVYFPAVGLSMDNAAMVGGLAYQLFKKGHRSDLSLNVDFN